MNSPAEDQLPPGITFIPPLNARNRWFDKGYTTIGGYEHPAGGQWANIHLSIALVPVLLRLRSLTITLPESVLFAEPPPFFPTGDSRFTGMGENWTGS